jgi:hypothetical protein
MRCGSYASALKVAKEKLENKEGFATEHTKFGGLNHELFEEESRETGKLPECFGMNVTVDHIEQEFAIEVIPGVILHFRPDSVSESARSVYDYKTMNYTDGMDVDKIIKGRYGKATQLRTYSYGLWVHGIPIERYCFLIELWDKRNMKIVGYRKLSREFLLGDIPKVKDWLTKRAFLLGAAMKELS